MTHVKRSCPRQVACYGGISRAKRLRFGTFRKTGRNGESLGKGLGALTRRRVTPFSVGSGKDSSDGYCQHVTSRFSRERIEHEALRELLDRFGGTIIRRLSCAGAAE